MVILLCSFFYSYLGNVSLFLHFKLPQVPIWKNHANLILTVSNSYFFPICDKFFKDANGDSNLLVIPRRAFYDNRKAWKHGKGNVIVVLVEMSEFAFGTVSTCEINGNYTLAIDDVREDTSWIKSRNKQLTHALVFVFCVFVPQAVLMNGASVKLIYRGANDSCYSRVETEYPLIVKPDYYANTTIERGSDSVVICIPLFNRPPYFNEWLKYQKHLGADMVYIAADLSFSINATLDYPFLKEALDSGFAKMEEWRSPLGNRVFWYSQLIKYQTCLLQFLGVFQYAFMLDSDDFFVPLIPDRRDLHYYTTKVFTKEPKLATGRVRWLNYCNSPNLTRVQNNGNLTAALTDYSKIQKSTSGYKALHRIDGVLYVGIHTSFTRVKGYYTKYVDSDLAYVSHIRPRTGC